MREQPLVSVIILNHNGRHMLKVCLDSVVAQRYGNLEIILVDNGSSDASVEFVRENYPARVQVIANSGNLGYVLAANQGIECSKGEFLVVLNNDTRADKEWIAHLVRKALSDPDIGICASKQLKFDDPRIIDSAGVRLFRGGYARDRGKGEVDRGQYEITQEMFGAAGASAFYRRAMLDRIGLFDKDYFAYCEEFDLCFRALLYGWLCVYVPDAVVYHMGGATRARKDERFLIYYIERNRIFTIIKNYPLKLFLLTLPYLLKYELDILMRFFMRFEKEVMTARFDALKLLPKMLAKRRLVQISRKIPVSRLRSFIVKEEG
jgi:GT2 family glycosyltransferase